LTEVVNGIEKPSLNSAKIVHPTSNHALNAAYPSLNLKDHHL